MTTVVILDADFLSAMLKIGRLALIRNFYQVQNVHLAPAVHREIAQTTLLSQLASLPLIHRRWKTCVKMRPLAVWELVIKNRLPAY